jgi:hypothetical protein
VTVGPLLTQSQEFGTIATFGARRAPPYHVEVRTEYAQNFCFPVAHLIRNRAFSMSEFETALKAQGKHTSVLCFDGDDPCR